MPWSGLSNPYRSKIISNFVETVAPHCVQDSDATQMLKHLLGRLARNNPTLDAWKDSILKQQESSALIKGFVDLREKVSESAGQRRDKPIISINELDQVFVDAVSTIDDMKQYGISMGKPHFYRLKAPRDSDQATSSTPAASVGGRPSVVNNPSLIAIARKYLEEHAKESERIIVIGRGKKKRLAVAKHLTKTRHRLWREFPELHKKISWQSFRRMVRIHFPHIRSPRRNTDVCKHCKNFSKYLLPAAVRACKKIRQNIVAILPSYFNMFDSNNTVLELQERKEELPLLRRFQSYIDDKNFHAVQDPDRTALSRAHRLSLHACEAEGSHQMKGHLELLDAYEWHAVSAKRQSNFVEDLRQSPPANTAIVHTDFKENVKYPMSPDETGEEWHAQNKLSLTVFGANAMVPSKSGGHVELFVLLVTDVLDHDAQAASMMTNTVLAELRQHPNVAWNLVQKLIFVADCGPHFRSYENVAHYCVTLPTTLRIPVEICWLGEQHGKSGVDRCFGWCNAWIAQHVNEKPIHNLDHLIEAFLTGSSQMMREDPAGPCFRIVKWHHGDHRPSSRSVMQADDFKVSRTYSMVSLLSSHSPTGVKIYNKVFSDCAAGRDLGIWEVRQTTAAEPVAWRVGYYDKPRAWEEHGPEPGQSNQVTRRFADQKPFVSDRMPSAKPSFLQSCSAKALSLRKNAAKKKRQLAKLRGPASPSASSSSSSSSSSSTSSDSDANHE